eukprot:UN24564
MIRLLYDRAQLLITISRGYAWRHVGFYFDSIFHIWPSFALSIRDMQ